MDISAFILMIYLSYRNGIKAKEKGANGLVFGVITFILYGVTTLIGLIITFVAVFRNNLDMVRMERDKTNYSQELAVQFAQEIIANPIHYIAIMMCGMGGYLLVNYIISRLPERNITKVE